MFVIKNLYFVGIQMSNWRVLLSMVKGGGRREKGEQGDEVRLKGFGVVE